jgi:hypothetical protein
MKITLQEAIDYLNKIAAEKVHVLAQFAGPDERTVARVTGFVERVSPSGGLYIADILGAYPQHFVISRTINDASHFEFKDTRDVQFVRPSQERETRALGEESVLTIGWDDDYTILHVVALRDDLAA